MSVLPRPAKLPVPDPQDEHVALVKRMYQRALSGWYTGSTADLIRFGADEWLPSIRYPEEVTVRLMLTRDRMHHSVGWWRNAEYEYCWHLSISSREALAFRMGLAGLKLSHEVPYVPLEKTEEMYWGRLFFQNHADKVWHEPGGTDPRLTREEKVRNRAICHLRLFLDPETFQPFMPQGEVYQLTRWIPGLTPEKVDR